MFRRRRVLLARGGWKQVFANRSGCATGEVGDVVFLQTSIYLVQGDQVE